MKVATLLLSLIFISAQNIMAQADKKLHIIPLTGNYYIYTTYNFYEGEKLPAHGMYVVLNSGVLLLDTPWDTTQFQPLLDSIKARHQKNVTYCIATHWHSDRTGGLEYYKNKGIKTYTTTLTDELCRQNGKKRAAFLLEKDSVFNIDDCTFETYYPGAGHTVDNIVVWFKKEKILYAGCLIKGAEAESLGYLGDGDTKKYYSTLKNVEKKFPHPAYIIVSHHDWRSPKSLKHSIKLAKKLSNPA